MAIRNTNHHRSLDTIRCMGGVECKEEGMTKAELIKALELGYELYCDRIEEYTNLIPFTREEYFSQLGILDINDILINNEKNE